jgi:hypothetical protein
MPETPTFGRYAEIPYDEMTPEQREGIAFWSILYRRGPDVGEIRAAIRPLSLSTRVSCLARSQ